MLDICYGTLWDDRGRTSRSRQSRLSPAAGLAGSDLCSFRLNPKILLPDVKQQGVQPLVLLAVNKPGLIGSGIFKLKDAGAGRVTLLFHRHGDCFARLNQTSSARVGVIPTRRTPPVPFVIWLDAGLQLWRMKPREMNLKRRCSTAAAICFNALLIIIERKNGTMAVVQPNALLFKTILNHALKCHPIYLRRYF